MIFNMAESTQGEQVRSKIPRYVRTAIPVSSVAYKKTLSNVSDTKRKVDECRKRVALLTEDMSVQRKSTFESLAIGLTNVESHVDVVRKDQKVAGAGFPEQSRKVILTPGGTKRKGEFLFIFRIMMTFAFDFVFSYVAVVSHHVYTFQCIYTVNLSNKKFKANLQEAPDRLIESILMVEDLMSRLNEVFPDATGFEQSNVLSTISRLFGKKIEYMGKKKKYDYVHFNHILL
jgi:hypothetical protein